MLNPVLAAYASAMGDYAQGQAHRLDSLYGFAVVKGSSLFAPGILTLPTEILEKFRALREEFIRRNIPQSEWMVTVVRAVEMGLEYAHHNMKVCGIRIVDPCRQCGRIEQDSIHHTCDGCGFPRKV